MNKTYECMVLLDNREVRQGWDTLKSNVTGMLTKHGAEIVSAKLWQERRLAYPIQRQQRGTYLLVYFNAPSGSITLVNRELNMAEPVMRHMVTACEEIPETAHEPEAEFDAAAVLVEDVAVETPVAPEGSSEDADVAEPKADADAGDGDAAGDAGATDAEASSEDTVTADAEEKKE